MKTLIRSLALTLATALGSAAIAQNVVTVTGTVSPCIGVSYPVHITTNTIPAIDTTIYTGSNCAYSFTFFPVETQGTVGVETTCDGGATWNAVTGSWNPFLGTVVLNLSCNGGPSDCNACFTISSSQPWVLDFTNCTSGGVAPYTYVWDFDQLGTSVLQNPTLTLPNTAGEYIFCLTIADANGCTSSVCDSVSVDANGGINGGFLPCVACIDAIPATNGPAGPPIPWTIDAINCSTGGVAPVSYYYEWSDGSTEAPPRTFNQPGLYQVCIFMIDANGCENIACDSVYIDGDGTVDPVDPGDCTAAFWVMQGYTIDSLNPGTAVPIPNELWIWNLSTSSNTSVALTMTTTMGSPNATLAGGCSAALVGAQVTGPNIPGGTTVIAVDCPNVVLSNFATATGIALHTFTGNVGTGNYQFVWSWGDGTPDSTDPYPTHFYASGGPYLLCLTMTDDLGCTDTACDSVSVDDNGFYTGMILEESYARSGFTVNVLNQLPTGIPDRPAMESPVLWPNPVDDEINLSFNTTLSGSLPMTIIDLNGREVRNENIRITSGGNKLTLPMNDLVSGMYLVRFGNDEKAVSFRFVKR